LQRACGTLSTPKDVAHYARCPEVCRLLVSAGVSMQIAYKDKDIIGNVPYYNELGTIGVSTKSAELRSDAAIPSSSHHVNIASDDFRLLRDLIPEQAYKNSGKEIQKILCAVSGKSQSKVRGFYNSIQESDLEIWVGPSGGSLVKAGSTPLGANDKADTDAIAKTPTCMNISNAERRFIDAVRYRAVVAVHVPARWKTDIKTKCRSNDVVNLGLFYFHRCSIRIHDTLQANDVGQSFAEYYGDEGTWTFEPNPIYVLRPLFSKDNPMPLDYSKLTKQMEDCVKPMIFNEETDVVSMDIDRSAFKIPKLNTVTCRRVLIEMVNDRLTSLVPNRHLEYEKTTQVGRTTRLNKCSKLQIINEISRLTASSWHRLLQNNVYAENKVGYVKDERIGWVHGMYAIPNPIRSYNVTTSLLISTIGIRVGDRYPIRDRRTVKNKEQLVDTLMAIIVVTTTGRLSVYNHYAKFLKNVNHSVDVPDTKIKLDQFIEMMLCESGTDGKMCDYIGVLYRKSLMKKCTNTVGDYIKFLRDCRKKLTQLFNDDEFGNWVTSVHSYNYYKPKLGDILASVGSNGTTNNGRPDFVSHIILCHLDELFIDESTEIKDVELGYNGALGPNLINHNKQAKNPEDRWKAFAELILHILKTVGEDVLDVWGLERVGEDLVVVKINQRPVGLIDAESISCKLVATDERTNGSRLISINPKIYQIYEWPKRIQLAVSPILVAIARKATDTFSQSDSFREMDINSRFMFRDETNKWKRYISFPEGDYNEKEQVEDKRAGGTGIDKGIKEKKSSVQSEKTYGRKRNKSVERSALKNEIKSPVVTTHWIKDRRKYETNGLGQQFCFACNNTYREFKKDHAGAVAYSYDDRKNVVLYCPSCYQEKCMNASTRRAKRKMI